MQCKHFGTCGGCIWQNVNYKDQLTRKQMMLVDKFSVFPTIVKETVKPIVPSPREWYYRNKMEFIVAEVDGKPVIGLRERNRHNKIVNIEDCRLQSLHCNRIIQFLKEEIVRNQISVYDRDKKTGTLRYVIIREAKFTNQIMVNLVLTNDSELDKLTLVMHGLTCLIPSISSVQYSFNDQPADVAYSQHTVLYSGATVLKEKINAFTYQFSAYTFFQPNPYQTVNLYNYILSLVKGKRTVFDVYAGCAGISTYISRDVQYLWAIESDTQAVKDGEQNLKFNRVTNCDLRGNTAEQGLYQLIPEFVRTDSLPDVIIVDPPRAGLSKPVTHKLVSLRPEKIIFVSCNLKTLIPGLQWLSPFYKIIEVQSFDMFPQTEHLETVVLLERKN